MLFTFIADYKGGTYVSQVKANSSEEAVIVWAKELDTAAVAEFKSKFKTKLIKQLQQQIEGIAPVLLDGLKNAWCISVFIKHTSMLINIIQTDET